MKVRKWGLILSPKLINERLAAINRAGGSLAPALDNHHSFISLILPNEQLSQKNSEKNQTSKIKA